MERALRWSELTLWTGMTLPAADAALATVVEDMMGFSCAEESQLTRGG